MPYTVNIYKSVHENDADLAKNTHFDYVLGYKMEQGNLPVFYVEGSDFQNWVVLSPGDTVEVTEV